MATTETGSLEDLMADVAQKRRALGDINEKLNALRDEQYEAQRELEGADRALGDAVRAGIGVDYDGAPL